MLSRSLHTLGRRYRTVISTSNAPAAIGPYSQAIKANGFLFVSGMLGLDPKTMQFPSDNVNDQTRQIMTNLQAVLREGNSSVQQVVKTTILLADINDFAGVNEIYGQSKFVFA